MRTIQISCDCCGNAVEVERAPDDWNVMTLDFVNRIVQMDVCPDCHRAAMAWLNRLGPGGLRLVTGHGHPASPGSVTGAPDEPETKEKPPATPETRRAGRPMTESVQKRLDEMVDRARAATSPSELQEAWGDIEGIFNGYAVPAEDERDIRAIVERRKYRMATGN